MKLELEHPQNVHWTHKQQSAKKWNGQPFSIAHAKLDGWRVEFFVQPNGQVVGYGKDRGKSGERSTHLEFTYRFPRLVNHPVFQRIARLKPYTSVACEITTCGQIRSDVVTALLDPRIPLEISAFAVPYLAGSDCRKHPIEHAVEVCARNNIPFVPYMRFNGSYQLKLVGDELEKYKEKLLAISTKKGYEGWILKDGGQYGSWWKLKPEPTVDCVVIGTKRGLGKYRGQTGALVVGLWNDDGELVEVASISGMTDEERGIITRLGDRVIDRVVEVQYQLIGSGGRLIHPRFKRWREDKPADQCTMDQLTEGA